MAYHGYKEIVLGVRPLCLGLVQIMALPFTRCISLSKTCLLISKIEIVIEPSHQNIGLVHNEHLHLTIISENNFFNIFILERGEGHSKESIKWL